jgi:hypothetical protein
MVVVTAGGLVAAGAPAMAAAAPANSFKQTNLIGPKGYANGVVGALNPAK